MRKINGKLFLALLVTGALATGGVFAVHYFQYQRIAGSLLYQARKAEEQNQPARAAQYLQRYLEFNPRDVTEKANLARHWTGDAFPAGSKARRWAVSLLDEVLRQEDSPELRRLLIKSALEQGEFTLARDHLQRLLRWQDVETWLAEDRTSRTRGKPLPEFMARENKDRGELEGAWGQIQESDRKTAEAIGCYRLATRHAPRLQPNFVRLAYLLRRQSEADPAERKRNLDEADRTIEEMVKHNTSSYEAYLGRWRYRRDFDLLAVREAGARTRDQVHLDAAAEDVAQALKRRPEGIDVLLAAADLERLRGRVASEDPERSPEQRREALAEHRTRALEYLKRGQDLTERSNAPSGDFALFQLLWQKGNLILDDLDLQRAQSPDDDAPRPGDAKMKEDVADVIARVRRTQMPAAADYMQARLLFHERKWGEAASLFERARAQLAAQRDLACQADLYLGQCYEKLEDHTLMFSSFQRVLEYDPASVPALIGMAAARWSQGQLDNALLQYQAVIRQKRVPVRAWVDIVRLELQRQGQSLKPDWSRVEKVFQAAGENLPKGNLELTLLKAELLVRQGKGPEARQLLEAARQAKPKEVEYHTALVDLALREKSPARARSLLDQARRSLGDLVGLRLAEARYLASLESEQEISRIAQLADSRDRFPEPGQARLLTGLADTLFRAGKPAEARKLWAALASLPSQRSDLRLRMLLFDLAMKENDVAGMRQALADLRAAEQTSGAYHRYGEALFLIWQAKRGGVAERAGLLDQARQQLDAVATQRPAWAPVFLARAEIAELNGNPEQAIKDLQEAVKMGDDSPSVLRRLATLLTQRGRDGEAQLLLAKLQQSVLYGSDLGKLAVTMAVRRGELGQAVEMMRRAVREDTKNPEELVWMAQVLLAANQADEAERRLREAIQVGGGEPAAWLAMVQFLLVQKRKDEALATIAQAKQKLPKERAALALGRCHDFAGQPKQALAYYAESLQANPNDPATLREVAMAHLTANRGKEAEPLLRRLVAAPAGANATDVEWARRALAVLLSSGTDYQRFSEALALVGVKLDEAGRLRREEAADENTENRRTRARVLASQNQRQFRQRAIEILEELAKSKALTADDEFVLALLYEAEGDTRKSQDKLKALTQPQTRTPQYLAQYASSLISFRRTPEALAEAAKVIGWLEELERQREVGPNGFASVEMRARLLEARGRGEDATALLRKHIAREGAQPEEVLLLLASLNRQKRHEEALELCEKTWREGKCMPEAVGGVSVMLLRVMSPTDAQVARVEKHLLAALRKKPQSNALRMHLADLYDKRGQYDRAADLYRAVLKSEPNNVVALNNLAWLLAHRSGDAEEALACIDRAVHGIGRRADLLDTRGVVHLARKDTARALADLREANGEGPTAARLFHLARAHHEERDAKRAREALRQAKEQGLQVANLHPVEQDLARRLLEEYGMR
jgi:Tfp pilus assembly protein PilF